MRPIRVASDVSEGASEAKVFRIYFEHFPAVEPDHQSRPFSFPHTLSAAWSWTRIADSSARSFLSLGVYDLLKTFVMFLMKQSQIFVEWLAWRETFQWLSIEKRNFLENHLQKCKTTCRWNVGWSICKYHDCESQPAILYTRFERFRISRFQSDPAKRAGYPPVHRHARNSH